MNVKRSGLTKASSIGLVALAAAMILPGLARADFITFDPDGSAAPNAPVVIGGFDFSPGNALAVGGVTAINAGAGSTFQLLYQSTLSGLINTAGNTFSPTGLNSTFEITAVASLTEVITNVNTATGRAEFAVAPVQTNSFLEIYFDSTPDANPLAGTGFNNGTRIALLNPFASPDGTGSFRRDLNAAGQPITQPLDQFGANNYPGITSVTGNGSTVFRATPSILDPTFFVSSGILQFALNTSQILPFGSTDPSALFVGAAGGAAPAVPQGIGAVNGVTGPNLQLQVDANAFPIVPEPASMVLMSMGGLFLIGFARRRPRLA